MSTVATTVVVVPREAHSPTVETLHALFAAETGPSRLVVVDAGSPRGIRRQLEALAAERDFTLLRSDAPLTGNEARNLAMSHVCTEFVVFLDNDTLVHPGWLEALERCAVETDAWLVSPVVLWGPEDRVEIHFAGGMSRIVDDAAGRRFEEHSSLMHHPAAAVASLTRARSEFMELHCLLCRVAPLRALDSPFDEGLVAGREHSDLTLRLAELGGSAWVEPAVVVRYPWPKQLRPSDYPFYLARWSSEWAERTFDRFNSRWGLTDTTIDDKFLRGHLDRRLGSVRARSRRQRFARRARRAVDRVVTPLAVRRCDRQRARARPPRVLRRASWDR